ncbi:YhcH/YjgK/YiaL family protein [Helicobacter suis]|uniref:YhcH/YjgK/YiaL family protein n=1 Tax=Helicobacter suis TaxID=104628 RepID=UPI001F08651D|nr:YhcH/YjgK/YiaL family protein [Helicobacter suis]
MAVIGKLVSLASLFSKTQELESLYAYLEAMLDPASSKHQAFLQRKQGVVKQELVQGMSAAEIIYTPSLSLLETHQDHIDFLLMVQGSELLYLGDSTDLEVKQPYDSSLDKQTYKMSESCYSLRLDAGMLAILFSQDAHATAAHTKGLVYKIVAKVPTNLIKFKL